MQAHFSMKVLHISKYYPPFAGGIEHFIADLHESISRQGIQSFVLAHQHHSTRKLTSQKSKNIYFVPVLGTFLYKRFASLFEIDQLTKQMLNTYESITRCKKQ
ncbi:glycosyl transferase family 1 [Candidatus Magnetomorum sp. HK-1]|nr:glycosyl transferase family 1 [Candidatus Magnetomorum sp. HK-1]